MWLNINFKLSLPCLKLFTKKDGSQNSSQRHLYRIFSDFPADNSKIPDILERKSIVSTITDAVLSSQSQVNFLVAGEWGIGKSSILKSINNLLIKNNVVTLEFSPWRYSKTKKTSTISQAFIAILAKKLNQPHIVNDLYQKKQIETEKNIFNQLVSFLSFIFKLMIYSLIFIGSLFLISRYLKIDSINKYLNNSGINQLITVFVAALFGQYFINQIRERGELEQVNDPQLLEEKFKKILNGYYSSKIIRRLLCFVEIVFSETSLSFLGRFLKNKLLKIKLFEKQSLKKLVVFVDDLDRCAPEEVLEFLSAIKTFLDDERVYYIIAADINQLNIKKDTTTKKNYLRKIIQIEWHVPELNKDQRIKLLNNLIKESKIDFLTEIEVNQLSYLFSITPTPRKIKYSLRKLLFLLNLEEQKSQELISDEKIYLLKMIMIQDLNTETYKYLTQNINEGLKKWETGDINSFNKYIEDLISGLNTRKKSNEPLYKKENCSEKESVDKIFKILQSEPKSSCLKTITLPEVFRLIGRFEEPLTEISQFNQLAKENPEEATKFIFDYPWEMKNRIGVLLTELEQDISNLIANQGDENIKSQFINRFKTLLNIFNHDDQIFTQLKYAKQDFKEKLIIFKKDFIGIPGIENIFFKVEAIKLFPKELWEYLKGLENFNNLEFVKKIITIFETINFQDIDKSRVSPFINSLDEKIPVFIGLNQNEVDPITNFIIKFNNGIISESSQSTIVDIINPQNKDSLIEIFLRIKNLKVLSQLFNKCIDLNLNIEFERILNLKTINKLPQDLAEKINSIQEINIKKQFIRSLTNKTLLDKNKIAFKDINHYKSMLDSIYNKIETRGKGKQSLEAKAKREISRFLKKIEKLTGGKYARKPRK